MRISLALLPLWVPSIPPLGIASIAAVFRKEGHDVWVCDLNHKAWLQEQTDREVNQLSPWSDDGMLKAENPITFHNEIFPALKTVLNQYVKELTKYNPDLICFSINQINVHSSRYVIRLLKKIFPDKKILVGGPDIYETNNLILSDIKEGFIDFAIIGEGEESVVDVLRIIEGLPPNDSNGILTKENVLDNSFRGKRGTIDSSQLPIPDFSDMDVTQYEMKALPVMMSRGCVAACSFCTEFVTWRNYRVRTAQHVFNEIKNHVEHYGAKSFFFCDSLINGNHAMLSELVNLINENDIKISWQGYCRADSRLDFDLLERMAKSGCEHLNIGFESGSDKVLKLMNKNNTASEGERVAKDCLKLGIKIRGLFIIGFPGEEEEDFNKTIEFISRNKESFSKVYIGMGLAISHVSPMGQRPKHFDIKVNGDGSVYLDSEGQWVSRDGKFTAKEREERLNIMRLHLDSIGADWAPVPPGWKKGAHHLSLINRFKLKAKTLKLKVANF